MNDYKEVYYHEYCLKCAHYKKDEITDRCDRCLSEPINLHTHKPVQFEAKDE